MSKKIGSFESLTLNITEPMKANFDLVTLKNISLFVGANGTGKTFILVNVFAISMIANGYVVSKGQFNKEGAQFIYDNCFTDQNINGTIVGNFSGGVVVELVFEKGKIQTMTVLNTGGVTEVVQVKFFSSQMRTFDAINMYLKMRTMIPGSTMEEKFTGMIKSFKLYDVMYLEHLIIKMPLKVDDKMKEFLKGFDYEEDVTEFNVDLTKGEFYATINNEIKYLSALGKGHQSIFNMLMGMS